MNQAFGSGDRGPEMVVFKAQKHLINGVHKEAWGGGGNAAFTDKRSNLSKELLRKRVRHLKAALSNKDSRFGEC